MMLRSGLPIRLQRLSRHFRRNDDGVALVEFAMILPVMVALYVGGVALTLGIMTDRKVILLARSLGDLVARDTAISLSDSEDVFGAAAAVLAPYSTDKKILRMSVSSIRINNKGKTCVVWSLSPNAGSSPFPRNPKDTVDSVVPADLRASASYSSYLIVSEVEYDYTPIVGENIFGTIKMGETLFLKPRQSAEVTSYSQTTASTTVCPDT
jgi:Flp pilus assembly protein TadG